MRRAYESKDRVLLVNSGNRAFQNAVPLGLMTLATLLHQSSDLRCRIVDLPLEDPNVLETDIDAFWRAENLDGVLFVGFSTMCNTLPRTLTLARNLRAHRPDLPIVFGGPEASASAWELLHTYDFIDGIVVGEAEAVVAALVKAVNTGEWSSRPGLLFRSGKNRGPMRNADGPAVPAPLVEIDETFPVDYHTYPQGLGDDVVSVDVGRGCPYACTFCSTGSFFRRKFRLKSAARIVSEVSAIVAERPVRKLDFVHDMFTTNRKLLVKVCQALIDAQLNIPWSCSARTDRVDAELLALMRRAGCAEIYFGVETGSQRMQRLIKKNLMVDDAIQTLGIAARLGLNVTTSFIIGFPQETEADLVETLDTVIGLRREMPQPKSVQVHLFAPLIGTPLSDEYSEELRYDGYAGAATSVSYLTAWEEQEVRLRHKLFSSFYYTPNQNVARSAYKWLMTFLGDDAFRSESPTFRTGRQLFVWAQAQGHYPTLSETGHPRWTTLRRSLHSQIELNSTLAG